ncbi:metallophosphoesterase [Pontibacillus salicampi]|uniref:Metallophosphoesterase n=1 Tax=Pontibacillus salicampi TaxID=1449801 RepID=A0ABV6LML0_9BACI
MKQLLWSIIGVASLMGSFFLLFIVPTRWLKVERIGWETKVTKKIVQISDIHMKHLRVPLSTIKGVIESEQPDYIFLTGDFIDENEAELLKLDSFLEMIATTGVETYAVLGNHDRYLQSLDDLEHLLRSHQITLLKNEWVEKEDVFLVGIDDFGEGQHDMETSFSFSNPEQKDVIVLTHDPEIMTELDRPFTMLVAGHLHGKQVNIPYFFKLVNMGSVARSGKYQGKHPHDKGHFYISKGIGQSNLNIRFLVRSELTIHELGKR